MKTIEELEIIFYTKLQKKLKKLQVVAEITSKKLKQLNLIYILIYTVINACIIFYIFPDMQDFLYFFGLSILLYLLFLYTYSWIFMIYVFFFINIFFENNLWSVIFIDAFIFIASNIHKGIVTEEYSKKYFTWIVQPLLSALDPNFKYDPYKSVYKRYFKDSWLFNETNFSVEGSERIMGEYLNTSFQLSNAKASTIFINDKNKEEKGKTFFSGLVFACNFNKKLKYRTIVLPDTQEKKYGQLVGRFMQKKNKNKMKLMNLDHPEFEKQFKIYGEDEIETRYVLNHHLMQNILKLVENLKDQDIMFAFYLNNFVVFSNNFYSFSIPNAENLQSFEHIKNDFEIVRSYILIIENLHLNENLWKQ